MLKKLTQLIRSFIPKDSSSKAEQDQKLLKVVKDLTNPIPIDWGLSESDHKVISHYVEIFLREQEVDATLMVVSKDIYPNLHRFITALRGEGAWQESMDAYDYLETTWPELEPILSKAG